MTATAAVDAAGLVKTFGRLRAVDGIDLHVGQGEIFGVLGPNGAGKTTTLRMLATLLPIDAGRAEIFGVDVGREPHRIRQLVGVTGQFASVDEDLTGQGEPVDVRPAAGPAAADARAAAGGCSTSSAWRKRRTSRSRSSPAGCAAGWTSRRA